MAKVIEQIRSANQAISLNIASLHAQRPLLSQNILAQLRNLVEGVAVLLHTGSPDTEFNYRAIEAAVPFVRSQGQFNFLGKFHKLLKQSVSHYSLDGDASERLMLKYYEYLHRIRSLLKSRYDLDVLANLEDFPLDLDQSLREFHEKIAARIEVQRSTLPGSSISSRYYIHHARPFFVNGRIYYEVAFCPAINKVSKFDRIIAFSHIDIDDKYAATLTLWQDSIKVLGQTMPITIITDWEVSIRPCELKNFARLLGLDINVQRHSPEYQQLMHWLTVNSGGLLELVEMSDRRYANLRTVCTADVNKPQIFPMLDKARRIVRSDAPGSNVLRYLLLRMRNEVLKQQYSRDSCHRLSNLQLKYGCIPFDTMPFCTSLPGHNPPYQDLVHSLDMADRTHELLARRVRNNVLRHGVLYTPVTDLEEFGDVSALISTHNNKVYHKHEGRHLIFEKRDVFIRQYEDDTVAIISRLQQYASSGISGYSEAVERWLNGAARGIDDPVKKDALKRLFSQSRVALIYGAAGTGKSTMLDHIANYFYDRTKLFLAHTHPAIDNLTRKVNARNAEFRTVSSQIYSSAYHSDYDLLVIDECSTVSNADLVQVLDKVSFKLLVLVGDVHQIESIEFGNWFSIVRSFLPSTAVFELTTPFRTKNNSLLELWNKLRTIADDIAEVIARNGYSRVLDETLFEALSSDEIILCLNYDGLYGINNINRFLQSSNRGKAITWGVSTYKVGDPVLFHETERFRPVIYNNLKGRIVGIERFPGRVQFDIELDRPLTELDVFDTELEWLGGSTVRFSVYEKDVSDDDDDAINTTVPFQVAYAVSIHKAQGLEYDSVKVVITNANEEDITHSILYTAVTRAREHLRIFWTPETQQRVLQRLSLGRSSRDVAILTSRRGIKPVAQP